MHIGVEAVPDEHRIGGVDIELVEGAHEDRRLGLARADFVRPHLNVEQRREPVAFGICSQDARWIGPRVPDDAGLQASTSQRVEQRVGRGEHLMCGEPRLVLGIDETVRVFDAELGEQLSVRPVVRVTEDELAVPGRKAGIVATEPGAMPGFEQLVVPRELDEGIAPVEQDRFEHEATLAVVARRILWALLALTPLVLASRYVVHLNESVLFILAALALIPLAWLIGEATEHAAEHTGPGIGGFLNASFGNAPELIIALLAVADGLPEVVRGSLTGSVVSNILLVLGAAMIAGGDGRIDARSLRWQLAAVFGGVLLLTLTSIPAWVSDSPDSHRLFLFSIPVSVVLLAVYLVVTIRNLRIHSAATREAPDEHAWPLRNAILLLSVATVATAFVSEVLIHTLNHFGEAVGLSQFFISIVIVAIVGNAAEHGGAVVIARRGNTTLATEIAITSSMQVAVFVTPAVCLLSWIVGTGLPLSFRVIEITTMLAAAAFAAIVIWDGRSRRWEGFLLLGAYGLAVVAYYLV